MQLQNHNLPRVYLQPGEIHFALEPTIVGTVLGSCIAVTMFYPRLNYGAVCHAILPEHCCKPAHVFRETECLRYVNCTIQHMLERFAARGVQPHDLQTKLFGGAESISNSCRSGNYRSVGWQNVTVATEVLKQGGFKILVADVGGATGRKIFFHSGTGEVYLKRLNSPG